jgi:hypothetical protein
MIQNVKSLIKFYKIATCYVEQYMKMDGRATKKPVDKDHTEFICIGRRESPETDKIYPLCLECPCFDGKRHIEAVAKRMEKERKNETV